MACAPASLVLWRGSTLPSLYNPNKFSASVHFVPLICRECARKGNANIAKLSPWKEGSTGCYSQSIT